MIMEEILEQDEYKTLKFCFDEEDEKGEENGWYEVEWVTEIQDGREFADSAEFNNKDDAVEFYYSRKDPNSYVSVFNENGFRWRKLWK